MTLPSTTAGWPEPPDAPDQAFEADLIQVLAGLESLRATLAESAGAGRMAQALQTGREMLKFIDEFARARLHPDIHRDGLTTAVDQAARFAELSTTLLEQLRPAGMNRFFSWLGGPRSADPRQLASDFREAGNALSDALAGYFDLFGECFEAERPSREWQEASGVFLTELRRLLHLKRR